MRYTRVAPIQVNAIRSITRTTNQRQGKRIAVAGYTVNANNLTLVNRESYLAHAFCANKRLVQKLNFGHCAILIWGIETWLGGNP